ncbi:MAG: hypothetical protein ACJ76H_00725 [Bacteriovoracaceae bacterium]
MSGMTDVPSPVSADVLTESVQLSQEFLNQVLTRINQLPQLSEIRAIDLNQYVSSLTMEVGTLVEITTLISQVIQKRYKQTLNGAKESHVHLLFIMKGINQARQKEDLVALEDLIKYELKDNLTQWKIDLIPQAKRLLNS